MQQTRTNKSLQVVLISLFIALFFLSRVPLLSRDESNPDGVNWHYRSQQFIIGLKTLHFEKTYQHYHPGVTLMWISGVPVEIFKHLSGITTYDMFNFEAFHLVAKFSLIVAQLFLSLFITFLLSKFIGPEKATLVVALVSFEPFFLGNSRLYHMDVLLALFMFASLLLAYLALVRKSLAYSIIAGVVISLSFLTKSIGVSALFYIVFFFAMYFSQKKDWKGFLKYTGILLMAFVAASFLFFPALFRGPMYYVGEIFGEAQRIGIRRGHSQIIFGESTMDAGPLFYPLVIFLKVSPFTLIGTLTFCLLSFKLKRSRFGGLSFFLLIFYLGYFVFMCLPTKKIDRYMIPVFPYLAYVAILGYFKLYELIKPVVKAVFYLATLAILILLFIAYPAVKLFPYLFTYTSPLFGTPKHANSLVAQKPFGIGIFELKDKILQKYGNYPRLGFLDVKPMQSIYPNSKIFDIRVYSPGNYDLLILGINEEMPDKVEDNRTKFVKDYSLYINGLEYWRVYVKENK